MPNGAICTKRPLSASPVNNKLREVAFILTPDEKRWFFPEWSSTEACLARHGLDHSVHEPPANEAGWHTIMKAVQPKIMVGAWALPRIPDWLVFPEGPLRYLSYISGSVRKAVSVEQLERGLLVTNWGDMAARPVAECALHHILAALRRTARHTISMHCEGGWRSDGNYATSLFGKRVGIHGFGGVARTLVGLLRPFEVEITAYSAGVPHRAFEELGVKQANTLEELFAGAEVLVEAEALTPGTVGIVGRRHFDLLPDGGVFVNIARGKIVDEDALVAEAGKGRLHFALDVFHKEPIPLDHPLRRMHHVLLTPHIGGPIYEDRPKCGQIALGNVLRYIAGESVKNVVKPEAYLYMT